MGLYDNYEDADGHGFVLASTSGSLEYWDGGGWTRSVNEARIYASLRSLQRAHGDTMHRTVGYVEVVNGRWKVLRWLASRAR